MVVSKGIIKLRSNSNKNSKIEDQKWGTNINIDVKLKKVGARS